MVYKNGSAHIENDGALHIKFSDDYGATWSDQDKTLDGVDVTNFPMNPPDCAPEQDANEPYLMIAPNGDLVLHMWRDDLNGSDHDGTYQSVSSDGGETWSVPAPVDFGNTDHDLQIWTTDDHFVHDGVIYAGGRDFIPSPDETILVKSEDNGATWTKVSTIAPSTVEVGLEYLGNNRIIAVMRDVFMTQPTGVTYRAFSDDMGLTWSVDPVLTNKIYRTGRHRIWTKKHIEGDANWWNDNNLVMMAFDASGSRRTALYFSKNGGATWTMARFLDDWVGDGGYGDMFFNPLTGKYIALNYAGNQNSAEVRQYTVSVDWDA